SARFRERGVPEPDAPGSTPGRDLRQGAAEEAGKGAWALRGVSPMKRDVGKDAQVGHCSGECTAEKERREHRICCSRRSFLLAVPVLPPVPIPIPTILLPVPVFAPVVVAIAVLVLAVIPFVPP